MRINPINITTCGQNKTKNQMSFGAVLLNKATVTDRTTVKPVDVAIVELETEYRELLADLRLKHKRDVSEEEFKNLVDKERNRQIEIAKLADYKFYFQALQNTRPETNFVETLVMDDLAIKRGDKLYKGDFELMESLAKQNRDIADINERVKERNIGTNSEGSVTSMGRYLHNLTNGQRHVMPKGGYGMLKKEYGEGVAYLPETIDSMIWSDNYGSPRQRILMAVEPQADGNYRNLKPDTKVYGMAEIYTDRAMDAVEDMASENIDAKIERMKGVIEADKAFDELFQKFKASGKKDENIRNQLGQMARDICKKYNIAYGDFMCLSGKGKESYIYDVPEHEGREAMKKINIPEDNARPLSIWKLFSTDNSFNGTEETLLDAICKKARFSGIFTTMRVSDVINHRADFKVISGWNGEKLLKEGFIKRKGPLSVKI